MKRIINNNFKPFLLLLDGLQGILRQMEKNLIRPGVNTSEAFRWSRSSIGGRAIAQRPILNTRISLEALCKRRYESMLSWYQKIAPHKFSSRLFPIV